MSCKLELWQHGNKTGRRAYFFNSDDGDPMTTQMDQVNDEDTSAQVTGDCAWVIMQHPEGHGGGGFIVDPGEYVPNLSDSNHHGEGKGSTNHRFYKRGDNVNRVIRLTPPTDGYYDDIDIYFKRADTRTGQWGHFPWVTEDLLANPNDSNQLITSATDKGQPCPGAAKASIIGHRRYRCTYNTEAQITNLKSGIQGKTGGDPRLAMYNNIRDKFCNDVSNAFKSPGGESCLERSTGVALAKQYCEVGNRIHSDTNCTKENLSVANYDSIAEAYCEANPNDSFCSCYNVVNDKCADDSTTGPAGCDHPTGAAYVKIRNATPSDQKSLWDGQRKCGSVCTGAGKYLPDNNQAGCKTTIQICSQNFNVGSMSDSDITASCELNASDGPSAGDSPSAPSPAQESAQSELEEAEAAVARGDPGAQERLDAAQEALEAAEEPPSLTDFQNNPKAYIPKSLDGLKINQKQQIGAGVVGALVLGCMMMLLLLVVGASGSGGGPVKRRFR